MQPSAREEAAREAQPRDREVAAGALGLRAPVRGVLDLDLAQAVALDAGAGHARSPAALGRRRSVSQRAVPARRTRRRVAVEPGAKTPQNGSRCTRFPSCSTLSARGSICLRSDPPRPLAAPPGAPRISLARLRHRLRAGGRSHRPRPAQERRPGRPLARRRRPARGGGCHDLPVRAGAPGWARAPPTAGAAARGRGARPGAGRGPVGAAPAGRRAARLRGAPGLGDGARLPRRARRRPGVRHRRPRAGLPDRLPAARRGDGAALALRPAGAAHPRLHRPLPGLGALSQRPRRPRAAGAGGAPPGARAPRRGAHARAHRGQRAAGGGVAHRRADRPAQPPRLPRSERGGARARAPLAPAALARDRGHRSFQARQRHLGTRGR